MKRILILNAICMLFLIPVASAQSPQGMNYQAIARDGTGNPMYNQNLCIQSTITDGSGGTVLYQETFNDTTNQFGLFTIMIGKGTPVTGTFAGINWGSVTAWQTIEIKIGCSGAYLMMGSAQLMSVPYALYSANGGTTYNAGTGINITGTTITNTAPDQNVSITGTGATSVTGTYPNFTISSTDNNTTYTPGTGINITGNTITNTAPDQNVSITGTGATSVTGTYPNFTVSSTDNNTTYSAGTGINITGTTITNTAPNQTVTITGSGATSVTGTYPNFTVSSTDNNTTYSAGSGISLSGTTFSNNAQTDATLTGNGTTTTPLKIAQQGASSGQVLKWNGSSWVPANDSTSSGSSISGTTNYLPKFTTATSLGNSLVYDNGVSIGIGTASPSSLLHVLHTGTSKAGMFQINNAGNSNDALYVSSNGSGNGIYGYHTGTGTAGYFEISNGVSSANALTAVTNGTGNSLSGLSPGSGNAVYGYSTGTGNAGFFQINNSSNTSNGLSGITDGSGYAIYGLNSGLGRAANFQLSNSSNSSYALYSATAGTGAAGYFTNTSTGPALVTGGGNVGIGVASPGAKLEVNGQVKITGGSPASGSVLTSDATGLASWQAPANINKIDTILSFAGIISSSISGGASSWVFVGPTLLYTITSSSQKIKGVASAALGLSGAALPQNTAMCLCYELGAGAITPFVGGSYILAQTSTTRVIFPASAAVTGLSAGSYFIGFCVKNTGSAALDNNDFVNGWLEITDR